MFNTIKLFLYFLFLVANQAVFANCYQGSVKASQVTGSQASDMKVTVLWSGQIEDSGVIAISSDSLNDKVVAEFGAVRPRLYPSAHDAIRCIVGDYVGEFMALMEQQKILKIKPRGRIQFPADSFGISKGVASEIQLTPIEDESVCTDLFTTPIKKRSTAREH